MNKGIYIFTILSLWAISLFFSAAAMDTATIAIMPFVNSRNSCIPCHKTGDVQTVKPYRACSTFCLSCHVQFKQDHHPYDVRLKKIIDGMDLTEMKRVSCFSCHDLNTARFDRVSWKAESLFDSVFRAKDQYKTYYLTTNNREGGLCKKCH